MSMSRTLHGVKLFPYHGAWYTADGRYEIATEGQQITRCQEAHYNRNGTVCIGEVDHLHRTWAMWDLLEKQWPLGLQPFESLMSAAKAASVYIKYQEVMFQSEKQPCALKRAMAKNQATQDYNNATFSDMEGWQT